MANLSTTIDAAKYDWYGVKGPNTNQWWAYCDTLNMFVDVPADVLTLIRSSCEKDTAREQDYIDDILKSKPDWLNDKAYWYDGDDIEI